MAGPPSLKKLACKAISTFSFNMLVGSPSALPEYFKEEALKTVLVPVRKMLLRELNRMVFMKVAASEGPLMDYCTILEGILDDHVESLLIYTPLPCRSSFSKLMSVLTHRCPKLRLLDITFCNSHAGIKLAVTPAPISHLTSHLNQLYSLYLSTDTSQELIPLESLLSTIGQTCPKLEELHIAEPEKMCILALLMGEDLACALFPQEDEGWADDSVLCKLRMPIKYLNPLCFTLKTLNPVSVPLYGSVYTFLLRHLPKFRFWDCEAKDEIPVGLIKALHRAEEEPLHADQQAAFEEDCRASAAALNLDVTSSSTLLSGPLSIERIANVRIRDLNAVVAVGRMCPQLTSIDFEEDDNQDDYLSTEIISIYKTIFDHWPTIHTLSYLTLKGLNPDFVSILLNTFGSSVKHLTLKGCRGINLTDLWQCAKLEQIDVTNSTINSETSDPAIRTSSTFLPSLLKVKSKTKSLQLTRKNDTKLSSKNLGLRGELEAACTPSKWSEPTPIQKETIPQLAFEGYEMSLGLLNPPTRELASQIAEQVYEALGIKDIGCSIMCLKERVAKMELREQEDKGRGKVNQGDDDDTETLNGVRKRINPGRRDFQKNKKRKK